MKRNIKLLLIFISVLNISVAQNTGDKPKTVLGDRIDSMTKRLDDIPKWAGDPTPYGKIVGYDAEASNYKRFEKSPCFEKLGFSPFRNPDEQERMYQSCESGYYKGLMIKIVSSVLIFGFIAYMIYISLKRKKKLSSASEDQTEVEDKK